ncbi:MAG: hypothetical protein SWZ49_08805 [Cyanobacteriota bacterium]|nr:hypothetical protein [Cyanobacteriota bacterium]
MIRRLVLTAGFAVLGAVAFAPGASAQTAPTNETVQFEGEILSACTFTPSVDGVLVSPDARTLNSTAAGGSAGTTTVDCNAGTITVAAPAPTGTTPTPADVTLTATVTDTTNPANTADSSGTSFSPAAANLPLDVDMEAVAATNDLPAGIYTYDVVVTASPN